MLRIGIPENVDQDLLHDFPTGTEVVRLPNRLEKDTAVDFWIPPPFRRFAEPMFPHLRGVKVVQSLLAGVDWMLPWLPKDITLCDGQGIHDKPVGEWVVGAILAMLKRFPEFRDRQHEHFWDGQVEGGKLSDQAPGQPPYRVLGDELGGKTVLIAGYGGIGAEIERMLSVFDVEIVRVARSARPGVSPASQFSELLPSADIVILLVPLTAETRGMMNADMLGRIKQGALLVNVARGSVVDTDALLAQLRTRRIHAVLDVTDPEPLPPGHPLWSAPNCFITPHVAGSVAQFTARGYKFAAEQVRRYLAGEPLHNRVNALGY